MPKRDAPLPEVSKKTRGDLLQSEGSRAILDIVRDSKYGIPLGAILKVVQAHETKGLADDSPGTTALYHRVYKIVNLLLEQGILHKGTDNLLHYVEGAENLLLKSRIRSLLGNLLGSSDKHLYQDLGHLRAAFTGVVEEMLEEQEHLGTSLDQADGLVHALTEGVAEKRKKKGHTKE